jgi:hypothetical protein
MLHAWARMEEGVCTPQPEPFSSKEGSINLRGQTDFGLLNPKPEPQPPKPETPNPKPATRNPQPSGWVITRRCVRCSSAGLLVSYACVLVPYTTRDSKCLTENPAL